MVFQCTGLTFPKRRAGTLLSLIPASFQAAFAGCVSATLPSSPSPEAKIKNYLAVNPDGVAGGVVSLGGTDPPHPIRVSRLTE